MTVHFKAFDYTPDAARLLKKLCLEPESGGAESEEAEYFLALLAEWTPWIKPKCAFVPAAVSLNTPPPGVLVGDALFKSEFLRTRIQNAETVWAFLVTCGREGYDQLTALTDPLEKFWAEYVLEDALDAAWRESETFFHHEVYVGKTAAIAPGSRSEWPIAEQDPLFRLLGDAAPQCGVTLTNSMLMLPPKTVSGIRFSSEEGYVSCAYCGRGHCPRRRTAPPYRRKPECTR